MRTPRRATGDPSRVAPPDSGLRRRATAIRWMSRPSTATLQATSRASGESGAARSPGSDAPAAAKVAEVAEAAEVAEVAPTVSRQKPPSRTRKPAKPGTARRRGAAKKPPESPPPS